MSDYFDIIARLEKATDRSDWNLDKEIAVLMREEIGDCADAEIPAYTSSIDAALTLVPEGFQGSIAFGKHSGAILWESDPRKHRGDHRGANPAIALCIAAFEARATVKAP